MNEIQEASTDGIQGVGRGMGQILARVEAGMEVEPQEGLKSSGAAERARRPSWAAVRPLLGWHP